MGTVVEPAGEDIDDLLAPARALGFDKFLYAVEVLHGETNQPLQVIGDGFADGSLHDWLDRIGQDPLRRMVAKGEVALSNLPIVFENYGSSLSLPRHGRWSAGEVSLLRWSLGQGVRTGVCMAVRMPRGLYASVNFYGAEVGSSEQKRRAVETLFLLGHEAHARLATRPSRAWRPGLSHRESECLEWIARGKTNPEIGDILGVAPDTAKEHVQALFGKLGVKSRAQAVARGHALGYLT
jgi:DNA-binding CsgD family transcriptional regulator